MTSKDGFVHRYGLTVNDAVSSVYPTALYLASADPYRANDLVREFLERVLRRRGPVEAVPGGRAALILEFTEFVIESEAPELWRRLVGAVGEDDAEVLRLFFVERLTTEEIGRTLGVPGSTVEAGIRSLVEWLRRHFDEGTT